MVVAAGGKINQVIHADKKGDKWLPDRTTVFNVQVLNSAIYKAMTDQAAPSKPMTAKDYANHGFPFFELYEEQSGISGDFSLVNSIGEIDQKMDGVVKPDIVALVTATAARTLRFSTSATAVELFVSFALRAT
jgi:hypothetical protein